MHKTNTRYKDVMHTKKTAGQTEAEKQEVLAFHTKPVCYSVSYKTYASLA